MSRLKFYKNIIWSLLILNILMIAFFFITKPKHPPKDKNNFQAEVITTLQLDDQQKRTFQKLVDIHKKSLDSINTVQQKLLPQYFENISSEKLNEDQNLILDQYKSLEGQKLALTYRHFQDVKSILTNDQIPYFEHFVLDLSSRILGSHAKKPGPRKK